MGAIAQLASEFRGRNWSVLLWSMGVAPLILGNPFFVAVAQEGSTSAQVYDRKCAVTVDPFNTGAIACTPVAGVLSVELFCSGYVRQYPAQEGCVGIAKGIRCMKTTFPPLYVQYDASGVVSSKSSMQILWCMGMDQGGLGCLTAALVAITGVILLGPAAAGASVGAKVVGVLINTDIAMTLADCALTVYKLLCVNACCMFQCEPGIGKASLEGRPWC
jgi:hypothetical protein